MRSPESRPGYRPGKTFEEELNLRYLSPGAFTVLSAHDNGAAPDPPHAPLPYRLSPTSRRPKNQSFAIIAEPTATLAVRSRSPSPTGGRVSPFRGRGFNPVGSRHASPAASPPPPPEDRRITAAKRSHIPQLRRRSSSVVLTDDSDSSPKFRRKAGLKPQLSKSLNYIGPQNRKPPPSPRRPGVAFRSRLSPIIGSSPEPGSDTKSLSSPSRIPTTRSQPASRKHSPAARRRNHSNTRGATSRDSSPSAGKPPISPTKIPVRNYRNVQAKVNSYNAKTNQNHATKSKVPTTNSKNNRIIESEKNARNHNSSNNNNGRMQRTVSVTKLVSKGSTSNLAKNNAKSASTTSINNNNNNNSSNKSTPKRTISNKNINKIKAQEDKDNNNSDSDSTITTIQSHSSKKDTASDDILKKVESIPKLSEMMPTDLVSATTTTVTQPLKIEAKLDTPAKEASTTMPKIKETPMYMDEGRVLSATSVSTAIERMNDTVLDSQTLLKDHSLGKLSPNATTIVSLGGSGGETMTRSVTTAIPSVETATTTTTVVVNNGNGSVVAAKNNIGKLIQPDDSFGAKVTMGEKTANERIVEARTMVASDVKPIKIMVQEKGGDAEVQSGNVRFPPNATNGSINSAPRHDGQADNEEPSEPSPPKSRCREFMDKCKDKMRCGCCKSTPKPLVTVEIEDESNPKRSCFPCMNRNKADLDEIIIKDVDDVDAGNTRCWNLKCCRSNKVEDSTGCWGRSKRKDSWADRRDSILSAPTPLTGREKCANFFRAMCCCCCKKAPPPKVEELASRRASMFSKKKSLTPTVLPPEEPKNKLDSSLVEYTSTMKAAIPVLPVFLAYFCLFFNLFAPGSGTIFSGLFCLCMGKPRFSPKDGPKPRIGSFIINIIIGCGQFFTVLFCLVGWGWSIWWGVIMVKLAKKYKKMKLIEERMEAEKEKEKAGTSDNEKDKDVEKGRS